MPAKGTKQVTSLTFDAVIESLEDGHSVKHIAIVSRLSPSTVRAIRQAKTWAEWERRKAAKVAKNTTDRKAKAVKSSNKIAVASKTSRAKKVHVRTLANSVRPSAPVKSVSVDDIEFQHPATKGDIKAMEDRLQKHLDSIADVLTTHARDEAIHRANVELEKPQLHISRRLDNMDQTLVRIERAQHSRRRFLWLWRRG